MQRFGEKLRRLRKIHRLTLKELAHKLGYLSYGYLSELEAGKKLPSVHFVLDIADFFDITTDQLLRDEQEVASERGQ
ncbi:MAG: helix-turn-helix transcriptional regulator [Chloroflexaceae bacterium]|nr:helix-turn-helix transcriptional regulator [Chloroflexaceae bacterium]